MKYALLALLLTAPAAATACVTAADLATGVLFTREDGRSGLAITKGRDIRVVYSAMNDDWTDTRRLSALRLDLCPPPAHPHPGQILQDPRHPTAVRGYRNRIHPPARHHQV